MEELKIIVQRLNKMFETDYNLSSFDAISGSKLMNLLIKVLNFLEIFNNQENKVEPCIHVLNVLEAIKYIPDKHIRPEDFRNGIAKASKDILHPILGFLLENQTKVKKRYYLSKYVSKTEVPPEFLQNDTKMQNYYQAYSKTIDDFWKIYSENSVEAKHAMEATELKDDISQMKNDLANLERRIEVQSNKIDFSGTLLTLTRELTKERKKNEKLTFQLETDNANLNDQIETVRNYQRRDKITKLEDLLEKSEYYASAQQIYSNTMKEFANELEIIERVVKSSEPFSDELQQLEEIQLLLQQSVITLNRAKQPDVTMDAFANQQKILAKKRLQLSKQIIKIRLNNEQVLNKVEEVCQILGGDVLRGKKLKDYIADLKALSNVYKKNKQFLKAMENETEILAQTLKGIYELEPDLKDKVNESKANNTPEEIKNLPLAEVKSKTLRLHKEYETFMKQCFDEERKYQDVKDIFSENLMQFDRSKHEFNENTNRLPEIVQNLETEVKNLHKLVKMEEEDLNLQDQESEKLQDNLFRYSQMIIENAGDICTSDVLTHKLSLAQSKLDEFRTQVNIKQQEIYALEDEKLLIKNTILLIAESKMK